MTKLDDAILFATKAHGEQKRKYTGQPYITHPVNVMELLKGFCIKDEDVLIAAVLHDVIEDTPVTALELKKEFGDRVTGLVLEVTDISQPTDGNRSLRKTMDRKHLAQASADAQNIKLADLIDNTSSIGRHDSAFAAVYIPEKVALLRVLTKGNIYLYFEAFDTVMRIADFLRIDLS